MKKIYAILSLQLVFLLMSSFSQIPQTLSYQGMLTKDDGNYTFTFRLYDAEKEGNMLWTEVKPLQVISGLFSTALGDKTPFSPEVKFDRPYWLGIQIGEEHELSPRIALKSVGYSMRALRADTALVATGESLWLKNGSDIAYIKGNVGIGIRGPSANLHIVDNDSIRIELQGISSTYRTGMIKQIRFKTNNVIDWALGCQRQDMGGASNPTVNTFYIEGFNDVVGKIETALSIRNGQVDLPGGLSTRNLQVEEDITAGNNIATGGSITAAKKITAGEALISNGWTITKVLEITGGMDLAEPFEISHDFSLPAGSVVVIDKENPGSLKIAAKAYDRCVAGVISGAGGINPGLTLHQEGVTGKGQYVALTGRVNVLASACNGTIEAGDLLTTSDVPGYAMKATDRKRWPGAIIGKAMTRLEGDSGLVIVLIQVF